MAGLRPPWEWVATAIRVRRRTVFYARSAIMVSTQPDSSAMTNSPQPYRQYLSVTLALLGDDFGLDTVINIRLQDVLVEQVVLTLIGAAFDNRGSARLADTR